MATSQKLLNKLKKHTEKTINLLGLKYTHVCYWVNVVNNSIGNFIMRNDFFINCMRNEFLKWLNKI